MEYSLFDISDGVLIGLRPGGVRAAVAKAINEVDGLFVGGYVKFDNDYENELILVLRGTEVSIDIAIDQLLSKIGCHLDHISSTNSITWFNPVVEVL